MKRIAFALTILAGTHAASYVIHDQVTPRTPHPLVQHAQYRAPFRYWGPYFFDEHEWDGPEYGNQGEPPRGLGTALRRSRRYGQSR